MDPNIILNTIKSIRNDAFNGMTSSQLSEKYSDFYNTYPALYNLSLKKDLDMTILTQMIMLRNQIKNGEITEDAGATSFGQILADKYLGSLLKKN